MPFKMCGSTFKRPPQPGSSEKINTTKNRFSDNSVSVWCIHVSKSCLYMFIPCSSLFDINNIGSKNENMHFEGQFSFPFGCFKFEVNFPKYMLINNCSLEDQQAALFPC